MFDFISISILLMLPFTLNSANAEPKATWRDCTSIDRLFKDPAATCPAQNQYVQSRIDELNQSAISKKLSLPKLNYQLFTQIMATYYPWVSKSDRATIDESFAAGDLNSAVPLSIESVPHLNWVNWVFTPAQISGPPGGTNGESLEVIEPDGSFYSYNPLVYCGETPSCGETTPFLADLPIFPALPTSYTATPITIPVPASLLASYSGTLPVTPEASSYIISVHVDSTNAEDVAKYFSNGQDLNTLSQLINSAIAKAASGKADLALQELLPSMPQKRMNTFPTADLLRGHQGPNCYNASANFFKSDVDHYTADNTDRAWVQAVESLNYREILNFDGNTPLQFGDIVQYLGPGGHAVRVLFHAADGKTWVFSKPDGDDYEPFIVTTLEDAFAPFFTAEGRPQMLRWLNLYRRAR
jgi:hypothetical protein